MMRIIEIIFYFSLIGLIGCSEPFSFDTPAISFDVVDAKVSNEIGRSYVDIYRIDNGSNVPIKDLDVNIISNTGAVYEFLFQENFHSYRSVDPNFRGEVGVSYKMEASDSGKNIYESTYDSIPEIIDFDVQLKDSVSLVFFENTTTLVEKRATGVFAEIPLTNRNFYAKLKFSYQIEDYFISGDSLYASDPTKYTLYKSKDEENDVNRVKVQLGERLIDKYFVFVDPSCSSIPRGVFTTNVLPLNVRPGVPTNGCYQYEEFWWITYEVTVESFSKSTYEYWENVEKLSKNDGLIFDTYPFPLVGNVSCDNCENQVVGSFRTVSESVRKANWK